ncbi:hypothetical protein [Pseudonocardia dioxanivorans]|uniref:hypothetical protein n=1 Tax=Pseudonocardia dioxanivorans TaxID=240495 RepID=UPI000CD085BD|nr:hypothetical protein [Pseudonocardia dioxanivorans]
MFGRRRKDAAAWEVVQSVVAPHYPVAAPRADWERRRMAGNVIQVYQRAPSGTKVLVDFGAHAGCWDTWWKGRRPANGCWVLVDCHLWVPPGTHSGQPVLWVDSWLGEWPGDLLLRARRHERRLGRPSPRSAGFQERPVTRNRSSANEMGG